jgi:hypothetical protein
MVSSSTAPIPMSQEPSCWEASARVETMAGASAAAREGESPVSEPATAATPSRRLAPVIQPTHWAAESVSSARATADATSPLRSSSGPPGSFGYWP